MTAPPPSLATALADRYRLERELGAGGMATVYLAEDVRHRRKVAVKVLHPELSAVLGPERFLKEITLTASLQHPHILPLFDSGSAAAQLYYVMPFVEGETLRARLERERQLPVADAVRIASEIADALAYAHARGVVHRDIKPENILLQDGHALVADFGIALAVEQAGGQRMTQTGISLGTPQYMAPEQAMGERNVDHRADIYALGVVTYEMLAGEPPFVGPTAQAIVAKVITETPRHLAAQRPSVPAHVDDAVHTALEKLPADRFATAEAFASALTTPSHVRTAAAAAGRGARRTTTVATAFAVVATIAAVWGWAKVARDRTATSDGAPDVRPWLTTLALPDSAQPRGPFALSPDGSRLVYETRPHGVSQLWMRDAGSLDARPLHGTDSASYPEISPDGRRVAFLAGNSLRVASLDDGRVTVIAELATHSLLNWADDENILISARGGIERVPLNGGTRQRVTTVDTAGGEVFNTAPTPLSGGQSILFVVIPRNYGDNARFQIAVSDPRTGRHRALLPGFWARYVEPGYLLVVRPDSALVAVPFDVKTQTTTGPPIVLASDVTIPGNSFPEIAVASTGQLVFATGGANSVRVRFARVRRDGASTIVDSTWVGQAREIAVSPDGAHAAAVVSRGTWDIQERDLRTGAVSYVSVPATVAQDPVFTSDGKSLLFIASGPQGGKVYEVPVGSASAPHLVFDNASANFLRAGAVAGRSHALLRNGHGWPERHLCTRARPARVVGPCGRRHGREGEVTASVARRSLARVRVGRIGHRRDLRALHGRVALRALASVGRWRPSSSMGTQWARAVLPLSRQPDGGRGVERCRVWCRYAAESVPDCAIQRGHVRRSAGRCRFSHAADRERRGKKESDRVRRSMVDVVGREGAPLTEGMTRAGLEPATCQITRATADGLLGIRFRDSPIFTSWSVHPSSMTHPPMLVEFSTSCTRR